MNRRQVWSVIRQLQELRENDPKEFEALMSMAAGEERKINDRETQQAKYIILGIFNVVLWVFVLDYAFNVMRW